MHGKDTQAVQVDMPYVVNILRHRAAPEEQIRKRCLRRDCPLRDDKDRSEMIPEGALVVQEQVFSLRGRSCSD